LVEVPFVVGTVEFVRVLLGVAVALETAFDSASMRRMNVDVAWFAWLGT
jgi:hypothetical protein